MKRGKGFRYADALRVIRPEVADALAGQTQLERATMPSESAGQLQRRLESQHSVRSKAFGSRYHEFLAYITELKARGMPGSVAWSAARETFSANTGQTEQEAIQFVIDHFATDEQADGFLRESKVDFSDEVALIEFDQKYRATIMLAMALGDCKIKHLQFQTFINGNMHRFDNNKPADDAFRFVFHVLWEFQTWKNEHGHGSDSKALSEQLDRHTRTRAMNAEAAD